jgi:2,3,4,5-tetrahydropyridine-2-carboxylate N-succinyltransferase
MRSVGLGVRRRSLEHVMDVWYPEIRWDVQDDGLWDDFKKRIGAAYSEMEFIPVSGDLLTSLMAYFYGDGFTSPEYEHPYSVTDIGFFVMTDTASAIRSVEEAYFKLHVISRRHVLPHGLCLDGIFAKLPNIAWTSMGPVLPQDLDGLRLFYWGSVTPLVVTHVDKFPYLVNYHVPTGVRIAAGSQVRLGAYLGEGTTVMPAGYVNFNAGTKGQAMIEGRVSAGVVVGEKSDVGGGASIMGTLSGGNSRVISIGPQCLLGANSGTGISLGTGCTIAAGLYIYSGLKIAFFNQDNQPINLNGDVVASGENFVKASQLSGRDYLLFIQDSRSGQIICKPNKKLIELNASLHVN